MPRSTASTLLHCDGRSQKSTPEPDHTSERRVLQLAVRGRDCLILLKKFTNHRKLPFAPAGLLCCLRSNYYRSNVAIHLVWRNDYTGSSLLNLTANRGIEINQKNIKTLDYHSHLTRSQSVEMHN
jgi:hypothetical protein